MVEHTDKIFKGNYINKKDNMTNEFNFIHKEVSQHGFSDFIVGKKKIKIFILNKILDDWYRNKKII